MEMGQENVAHAARGKLCEAEQPLAPKQTAPAAGRRRSRHRTVASWFGRVPCFAEWRTRRQRNFEGLLLDEQICWIS